MCRHGLTKMISRRLLANFATDYGIAALGTGLMKRATSQRGKSPKAGKGVGRKPAPEPLKAVTLKIPESQVLWLRENVKNKSAFLSSAIANAMAALAQ